MIARVAGVIVSVRLTFAVCAGEPESIALNASGVAFTTVVGVPLTKPVDELNARPPGSVPDASFHVYGVAPPLAVNVCEYDVPILPFVSEVVEIESVEAEVGAKAEMVIMKLTLAVWEGELESVTKNVSGVAFIPTVGFPLIKPVDELRLSPDGSVPEVILHA